jgi:hypothetical protein
VRPPGQQLREGERKVGQWEGNGSAACSAVWAKKKRKEGRQSETKARRGRERKGGKFEGDFGTLNF